MRHFTKQLKVLHVPFNIGGIPYCLAKTERQLGIKSWSISLKHVKVDSIPDEILWSKNDGILVKELKRWLLFIKACIGYDVIHFNFGHSIMPDWDEYNGSRTFSKYIELTSIKDLQILKALGKSIVVSYMGDDARQGVYCKKHYAIHYVKEVGKNYYRSEYDKYKRWKIQKFNTYADKIYAVNPDLFNFLPQRTRFLPYACTDLDSWVNDKNIKKNPQVLTIIHAPSSRLVKGTRFILDAVNRLQKEKLKFNFILIENMSHSKVKAVYQKADLLVDQLFVGWYGVLAVELMALGKPVISYIRHEDLKFIPDKMKKELPIIEANPSTIYKVLKSYLTIKREYLNLIGLKSRQYVEKWHNPKVIAQSLINDYREIANNKVKYQ